jgi:hypothetical protein
LCFPLLISRFFVPPQTAIAGAFVMLMVMVFAFALFGLELFATKNFHQVWHFGFSRSLCCLTLFQETFAFSFVDASILSCSSLFHSVVCL